MTNITCSYFIIFQIDEKKRPQINGFVFQKYFGVLSNCVLIKAMAVINMGTCWNACLKHNREMVKNSHIQGQFCAGSKYQALTKYTSCISISEQQQPVIAENQNCHN